MHKKKPEIDMFNMLLNAGISIAKLVVEISNFYVALSMCKSFVAACLCAMFMVALHAMLSFKLLNHLSNGMFNNLAKEYFDNAIIGKDNTETIEKMTMIQTKYNNFVLAAHIAVFCVLTTISRLSI